MPISSKEIPEMLYDLLPEMYRNADKEAQPVPLPLKRFLQVASLGMKKVETEIDGQQLLFDVDLVPAKYLDPLGRMIGFNFPEKMTEMEKRGLLKNLPLLYKLKGTDQVFDVIAKILFSSKNTKATTDWRYTSQTSTLQVILLVQEGVTDLEERMERFTELVEYFRPINVGIGWTLEVYYEDTLVANNFYDDSNIDILKIDDNLFGQHEYTGSSFEKPRLLNVMRLNTTAELYGILYEAYDFSNAEDVTPVDSVIMMDRSAEEDVFDKFYNYLNEYLTSNLLEDENVDFAYLADSDDFRLEATDVEIDEIHSTDTGLLEDAVSEIYEELNETVNVITSDSDEELTLGDNPREDEIRTDILINVENDEFSLGKSDDNSSSSQLINMNYSLNLGQLGSTMILSKPQEIIAYNY